MTYSNIMNIIPGTKFYNGSLWTKYIDYAHGNDVRGVTFKNEVDTCTFFA